MSLRESIHRKITSLSTMSTTCLACALLIPGLVRREAQSLEGLSDSIVFAVFNFSALILATYTIRTTIKHWNQVSLNIKALGSLPLPIILFVCISVYSH